MPGTVKHAFFVEGREDVAFISKHLQLTGKWKEFRRHGCHFVVAEGKQNLSRPLAISTTLKVPVFARTAERDCL